MTETNKMTFTKITFHSTYDEIKDFWTRQNDAANIIQKSWREFVEEEEEEILCGVGDTNIWSPKGCRKVLNEDDACWIEKDGWECYYCKDCYVMGADSD